MLSSQDVLCSFLSGLALQSFSLTKRSRKEDEIILLLSAAAVNPQWKNKICMGGSIALAHRLHFEISTHPKDSVVHFSFSCAPVGEPRYVYLIN